MSNSLNQQRSVSIIVPKLSDVSPINAAVSIAKYLTSYYRVTIVVISDASFTAHKFEKLSESTPIGLCYLGFNNWLNFSAARDALDKALESNRVNVAISFLIKADCLLAASKSHVTKISSLRDMIGDSINNKNLPFLTSLVYGIQRYALKRMDIVIAMNRDMAEFYSQSLKNDNTKVRQIDNFLDEDRINNPQSRKQRELTKRINKLDGFRFYTASSLIKRKNLEELAVFFSKLINEGANVSLAIFGEGALKEALTRIIKKNGMENRICLLGHVPDIVHYHTHFDAFVMSSKSEGLSRSLLEALYWKKPVLVREIFGVSELAESINGFFTFTNYNSFAEKANYMVDNRLKSELPQQYLMSHGLTRVQQLIDSAFNEL